MTQPEGLRDVLVARTTLQDRLARISKDVVVNVEYDQNTEEWVLAVRGVKCPVNEFAGYRIDNIASAKVIYQG